MRKKISKIALVAVLTTSLATISQAPLQANASFWGKIRNFFSFGNRNYNLLRASTGFKPTLLSRGKWSRIGFKGYGTFMNEGIDGNYKSLGNNPPTEFYRQLIEKN